MLPRKFLGAIALFLLTCTLIIGLGKLPSSAQTCPDSSPEPALYSRCLQTQHYAIYGDSESSLRNSMNVYSTAIGDDGVRYDALTKWYVTWSWADGVGSGPACRFSTHQTHLDVTLTLPEWGDTSAAPRGLVRAWHNYLGLLTLHENGHVEHGDKAAAAVSQALGAALTTTPCDQVSEEALNAQLNGITDIYKQKDIDYDVETNHGATQGARFPPGS